MDKICVYCDSNIALEPRLDNGIPIYKCIAVLYDPQNPLYIHQKCLPAAVRDLLNLVKMFKTM